MDEATLASVIQSLWTCINFDEEIARIRLKCAKKRIARTAVDFFFRTCCVFCRTEWFFMWLWAKFRRFSCSFGRTNVRKAWRRWACGEKGLISIKPKDLVKLGLLQKASLNLAFGLAGIVFPGEKYSHISTAGRLEVGLLVWNHYFIRKPNMNKPAFQQVTNILETLAGDVLFGATVASPNMVLIDI